MTMQLEITRRLSIAHQLQHLPVDDPCKGIHGHDWIVTIKVTGTRKEQGWLITFERMAELWTEHVHAVLDHQLVNRVITQPTVENAAEWIAKAMHGPLREEGVTLAEVRVEEPIRDGTGASIWQPWCEEWAAP